MGKAKLSSICPKTCELLEKSTPDVFQSFAVGVLTQNKEYYHFKNCSQESLYDLASLTKVLCTTTLYAHAEERGLIQIQNPVQSQIKKFPSADVKFSHLLNHSSGLPAHIEMYKEFILNFDPIQTPQLARISFEKTILESWKQNLFEKQTVYSDLGFMLLGWALESQCNKPLDALFQEWVTLPFHFQSLQFLPTTPDVVPTESCPWRKHTLCGEVHDDNCYVLGGVAGHAGLFGHVQDTLRCGRLWLDALLKRSSLISQSTAQKYWTFTHIKNSTRTLGWDGVDPQNSSAGHYFSPQTRGHLGFTGTSLWIDPEKELIVCLLTNRVYPTRQNEKIKAFRPLFHDTLLLELSR